VGDVIGPILVVLLSLVLLGLFAWIEWQ